MWGKLKIKRVGDFELDSFEDLQKLVEDNDIIVKFK
jgi:hypothetical protein